MMNREQMLERVSKWGQWPILGDCMPMQPGGWDWVIVESVYVLTHSIHNPITRADWQDAGGVASTPATEPDMVNHPPHYQSDNGIECIDAIRAALGREGFIAYCRGNAIKYLWRDKVNNVEDRNKAVWYINRANAEEQSCQQ